MNNLTKIAEKPIKRVQNSRKYKKFQEEKKEIEKDVNFHIEDHNSQYGKRNIEQEDIDDHIFTREYKIKKAKEIEQLAKKYNITNYKINFREIY